MTFVRLLAEGKNYGIKNGLKMTGIQWQSTPMMGKQ